MITAPPAMPRARLWQWLYIALVMVLAANFLWRFGFLLPDARDWIDDDARQFLTWSARIASPAALKGDLLADYWQSVTPLPFQWLLRGFALVGIGPVMAVKLLPLILLPFTALMAWKLAMALTRHPMVAFLAAGLVLLTVMRADNLMTGTPRVFSAPLVLLFLYGLVRGRALLMLAGVAVLGAVYPAPAVSAFGMLGLSKLRAPPRLFDWSWRTLALLGACVVALAAVALPFAGQAGAFGPAISLADAMTMPSMIMPDGRSTIVDATGQIGWLCSQRIGFAPLILPCAGPADPRTWLLYALVLGPAVAMGVLWWRGPRVRSATRWNPTPLYALALGSALVCYVIAAMVAFELHVPSRYSQRLLEVTVPLALGHVVGMACLLATGKRSRRIATAAMAVLTIALFVGFAAIKVVKPARPTDPAAVAFVRHLPANVVIAGLSDDLESWPALTGRAVIATPEHAIPYQKGYFTQVEARLGDTVTALASAQPAVLAAFVKRRGVTHIVVERRFLESGVMAPDYGAVVPDAVKAAEAARAREPSLVQRHARACAVYAGPALVIADPVCLVAKAP
ncbi:hypothetical protein NT2_04_02070 [Caenibius tardaugens NBRC 16725]|uniref:Glycosyltransferase RgtA/B/C/D-like domain-containing protein n=1 Tax=Caenibius tardaugens NBRC 16725 TaxID=1219035 RepID=U2YJY9_9SPHN|nr:hypothetical protein [Caenibius tardaugens]AZI36122.1 hypothetical protein EGO55_09250 [Caenibius tardaugens NBRC 16725]GAD48795.1 hypothetical protein NT2_04_02070 [Caenibius tardaugens NBRC 16725]